MEGVSIQPSHCARSMFKVEPLFTMISLKFPLSAMLSPFSPSQVTEGWFKMFSFQKYFFE